MKLIHNAKVVGLLGVLAGQIGARADGPLPEPQVTDGVFGANRRVETGDGGYTGVKGFFGVPEIRVTDDPFGSTLPFLLPYPQANSKPTLYLGCNKRYAGESLEVDAGAQYEWEYLPFANGVTTTYISPGWSVFVRSNGAGPGGAISNRTAVPSPGYRAPANVDTFEMAWFLEAIPSGGASGTIGGYRGILRTAVYAGGTRTALPDVTALGSNAANRLCQSLVGMRVKRVVGMTQGGSYRKDRQTMPPIQSELRFPLSSGGGLYDEDGSYMRTSTFLNGQVSLKRPTRSDSVPDWIPWSRNANRTDDLSLSSNGGDTGYYPPGRDHTLMQTTIDGTQLLGIPAPFPAPAARRIFEFPGTPEAMWDGEDAARYDNETISINLENGMPVQGKVVR